MFQQLNQTDGITLIIVTHDPGVAQHAQRIIRIKDGLIESDAASLRAGGASMKLYFTLKMALNALRHNVMRAALTTLGIIIGVAAVITMMEIGKGASLAIQRAMASIGANTVVVLPGSINIAGVATGSGSKMTLTPQDADAILKECPSVDWVAPVVRARVQVVYNNQNWVPTYVYGTTPRFLDIRDWTEMDEGEAFTEHDVLNSSKVCISRPDSRKRAV